jgi:hypothetical protein
VAEQGLPPGLQERPGLRRLETEEYGAVWTLDAGRRRGRFAWIGAATVGLLVLAIGVWAGYLAGSGEGGLRERTAAPETRPPAPTIEAESRPAPELRLPLTTAIVEGGSDVLAERRAGPAPPAATCPADADPNRLGRVGQPRPDPAGFLMWRAIFHEPSGRMILLDTSRPTSPELWAFDVCANAWEALEPPPVEIGPVADLVYDADSQLVVAFPDDRGGADPVAARDRAPWVLDTTTGEWRRLEARQGPPMGLVRRIYHPPSGLLVGRSSNGELAAFDAEAATWTQVRQSGEVPVGYGIVAYDAKVDELVLLQPVLLGELSHELLIWRFQPGTARWWLDAAASRASPQIPWPPSVGHDAATGDTLIFANPLYPVGGAVHSEVAAHRPGTMERVFVGADAGIAHCATPAIVYDSINKRVICAGSYRYSFDRDGTLLGIARMADVAAFDVARRGWVRLSEP